MLALILRSSCLTGPQLWPSWSSTTWSVHNCAKILSTQFLATSNSFIHLGSIPKWILHSILNFVQVEPPLNAMALVLSFKCLGNVEFGDVFSILILPLSQFLVVPFLSIHLHFNHLPFQIIPQISSQILQSIHISIPIYLLSQMRQFPLSIHLPLLWTLLHNLSGPLSLAILIFNKDALMDFVISQFQGLFPCWPPPQDQLCSCPLQIHGTYMTVLALHCRWRLQVPSLNVLWIFFVSNPGVIYMTNNLSHFQKMFFGSFFVIYTTFC